MTTFNATGGPYPYRLSPAIGLNGFDVEFALPSSPSGLTWNTVGTIPDQTIYFGEHLETGTFLEQHNWFNQGAKFRAMLANLTRYPEVGVLDSHNLHILKPVLPHVEVRPGGVVDLQPLLALLTDPSVAGDATREASLLAVLSSCAASLAQRAQLAGALGLNSRATGLLMRHGVLAWNLDGEFTAADYEAFDTVLSLLPLPIVDQLHMFICDESMPAAGGYASGGRIYLNWHAGGSGTVGTYADGGQMPTVAQGMVLLLLHEIAHMVDATSIHHEQHRFEAIFALGANDPGAFLRGVVNPLASEDVVEFFIGYCIDSEIILREVAGRNNRVLSQKLAHVIDWLPTCVRHAVPFFTTDPQTGITSTSLAGVTRHPGVALGDDGMIASVAGISL